MHAHSLRTVLRRENFIPVTILFLFLLVAVSGFVVGTVRSASTEGVGGASHIQSPPGVAGPNGEDIEKEFDDGDLKVKGEKPRGKWAFATVLDMSQFGSSSLPVAVSGIQSLSGGGRHLGITKIKRVELINRSPKIVNSVQLRWTLTPLDDPEKVLSEGATQFANIWVEASSSKVVEIPTLYPALLLKSLAKDGVLDGRFKITIGVQEARFTDGSFWRRQEIAAYLKFLDPYNRFPSLASLVPGIIPPRAGTSNKQNGTSPCALESRSNASAFFWSWFKLHLVFLIRPF